MNSDMMGSSFRQEWIEPIRHITLRGATHVLGTRDAGTPSFHSVFRAREALKGTYIFISSAAFGDGKAIPTRHATKGVSGGQNVSPPLSWANLPEGTRSLAVACIDRHPVANSWLHWLVINIPTSVKVLPEGCVGHYDASGGRQGAGEHVWDDGLGRSAATAWLGHASV